MKNEEKNSDMCCLLINQKINPHNNLLIHFKFERCEIINNNKPSYILIDIGDNNKNMRKKGNVVNYIQEK